MGLGFRVHIIGVWGLGWWVYAFTCFFVGGWRGGLKGFEGVLWLQRGFCGLGGISSGVEL